MESLKIFTKELNLEILDYVKDNPGCKVKSIYNDLKIEQSVCSKHLGNLIRLKDFDAPRVAKHKECFINKEELANYLEEYKQILLQ